MVSKQDNMRSSENTMGLTGEWGKRWAPAATAKSPPILSTTLGRFRGLLLALVRSAEAAGQNRGLLGGEERRGQVLQWVSFLENKKERDGTTGEEPASVFRFPNLEKNNRIFGLQNFLSSSTFRSFIQYIAILCPYLPLERIVSPFNFIIIVIYFSF